MNVCHRAWACLTFLVSVQCPALHFIVLIELIYLISQTSLWHFCCFSFRLWNRPWCVHEGPCNRPWCVHIHTTDTSVAMHRIVSILLFVLCLVPFSENCSQLKAIHGMRRGAGGGKPDGPQRLPIALGFKCVHCRSEFESRHAIDVHHRHSSSVGTPCADPRNHKSMSMTERVNQAAGILRHHETLGVLFIPDAQKMLSFTPDNSKNNA